LIRARAVARLRVVLYDERVCSAPLDRCPCHLALTVQESLPRHACFNAFSTALPHHAVPWRAPWSFDNGDQCPHAMLQRPPLGQCRPCARSFMSRIGVGGWGQRVSVLVHTFCYSRTPPMQCATINHAAPHPSTTHSHSRARPPTPTPRIPPPTGTCNPALRHQKTSALRFSADPCSDRHQQHQCRTTATLHQSQRAHPPLRSRRCPARFHASSGQRSSSSSFFAPSRERRWSAEPRVFPWGRLAQPVPPPSDGASPGLRHQQAQRQ